MKKTIIYFIRHGEVENPKKILYGRLPGFSISDAGRKKMQEVVGKLGPEKIDFLYTSPLLRARQTAKILGTAFGLTPRVSILLNEVKLICEGIPLQKYQQKIQARLYDREFIVKGQEAISEISQRMLEFVKRVIKKHKGKIIVAVSHGDPIMILKTAILNLPFTWEYKKKNYLKTGGYLKLIHDQNQFIWSDQE